MIPPTIVKLLAATIIPKIVDEAHIWLKDTMKEEVEAQPKPDPHKAKRLRILAEDRKPRDNHKFTKQEYDYILYAYHGYLQANEENKGEVRYTQVNLVNRLNAVLGINKSKTAYSKVWLDGPDRIIRDDLEDGPLIHGVTPDDIGR